MSDENIKKEENRTRRFELHIRLNEREYKALKRKKEWLKCASLNDVMRMYIHSGTAYHFDYSALSDCLTQLGRIGNNINQIAKVANATKSVSRADVEMLKEYLHDIEDLLIDKLKKDTATQYIIENDYY